jgi:TDG/mug DNA glycosylase family protein
MVSDIQSIPRTHGFEPLLCDEPRILILGTLPGGESLKQKQYYYSNSNRIWKVLCRITGEPQPLGYGQKKALLAKYHIVLWDYYESAIRPNSSNDKDIRDGWPNDIPDFIHQHPTIKVIAVNGFGKYKDFGGRIKKALAANPDLADVRVLRLPETSGSNKNYGWGDLNKLAAEWSQIFD